MLIISATLAFSTILSPINVELIRGICSMGVQIVKMMGAGRVGGYQETHHREDIIGVWL